jgi:hypothetical protein
MTLLVGNLRKDVVVSDVVKLSPTSSITKMH